MRFLNKDAENRKQKTENRIRNFLFFLLTEEGEKPLHFPLLPFKKKNFVFLYLKIYPLISAFFIPSHIILFKSNIPFYPTWEPVLLS